MPNENSGAVERWPGWPGDCVFRVIIPVHKVGAITGRKGEFMRKLWQETRARIQVLDGPATTPDCLVLISAKEKPEADMSPAMDAVVRVFRRVSRLPDNDVQNAGSTFSSVRLLVTSTQAIHLIGKQGSVIKSIVENSGASVRILSQEETPCYAAKDERIVALRGETLKIVKALEAVLGHLRKFLVDHSVLPLFEKQYLARVSQPLQEDEPLADQNKPSPHPDSSFLARREPLVLDRDSRVESRVQPLGFLFTRVYHKIQTLISYAEDIIGEKGANITYIRRTSGATIIVEESLNPDEIIVVIKGTSSQVQIAQQLIQMFISKQKDPVSVSGGTARTDTGNAHVHPPHLRNRHEQLHGHRDGPKAPSQVAGPSTSRH